MLVSPPHQSNSVGVGRFVIVPSSSKCSPDERSNIREHILFNPAFAEFIIGRAIARPVG
jgi:hypothetical protein